MRLLTQSPASVAPPPLSNVPRVGTTCWCRTSRASRSATGAVAPPRRRRHANPPPRYPLQLEIEEMRTEETEFNAARAPRPARRRPAEGRPAGLRAPHAPEGPLRRAENSRRGRGLRPARGPRRDGRGRPAAGAHRALRRASARAGPRAGAPARARRRAPQVHVVKGALVCPKSGRRFPINNGIPNMLLHEDEV